MTRFDRKCQPSMLPQSGRKRKEKKLMRAIRKGGVSAERNSTRPYAKVAEQRHRELIVKLEANGPGFRAGRVARVLGSELAVEPDANHGIAGLDFHAVPLALALDAV